MNINNNVNLPVISGYQTQEKREIKPQNLPSNDNEPKAKVNSGHLLGYNNISFKGRSYDGTNFRNELFSRSNGVLSSIKLDDETKDVTSYKTQHSEYILLPDNNKIYKLRYSNDEQRINQQVLASKLYQSVGIRTPEYIAFEKDGKTGYMVEVLEEKLNSAQTNRKALYDSFVADVWLGNRNGLNKDNTKIDENGNPVKMTVSGSLGYRATGLPKNEPFSIDISEIKTLRDTRYNREAAQILSSMTDEELYDAIETIKNRYSYSGVEKIVGNYKDDTMSSSLTGILNNRIYRLEDFVKKDKNEKLIQKRGLNQENLDSLNVSFFDPESNIDMEYLHKISDEDWALLEKRGLLTPDKNHRKFHIMELKYLSKMTDEQHEVALKRGLYKSYNISEFYGEAIAGHCIPDLVDLDDETWKKVEDRNLILFKKDHKVAYGSVYDFISGTINISDSSWQSFINSKLSNLYSCDVKLINAYAELIEDDKTKELFPSINRRIELLTSLNTADGKYVSSAEVALKLASVEDKIWKRFKEVTANFDDLKLNSSILLAISELDDDSYEVLKSRGLFDIITNCGGLEELSLLSDDEWENVQKRNLPELRPEKYRDWAHLASLTDEEYQVVLDEHLLENRAKNGKENYFDGDTIAMIVKSLDEKDWERVHKRGLIDNFYLFNGWGRDLAYDADFVGLAKLTDNDFAKFQAIQCRSTKAQYLYPETIFELAQLDDVQLKRYFDRHIDQYQNRYEAWDDYTEDAPVMKAIASLDDSEYEEFRNQKNDCKTVSSKILIIKANRLGLDKKNELSELTTSEKRQYLQLLLEQPGVFLDDNFKRNFNGAGLVPKDVDEYTQIMKKLLKSVGIDSNPVSEEEKAKFFDAINQLGDINGSFAKLDIKNIKLQQEYPKENFIQDILTIVSSLSQTEQMKVYDYFGFDIHFSEDGTLEMNGYPALINNGEKLAEITDEKTKEVIQKVKPLVKKFITENHITIQGASDKTTEELLNTILNTLPELQTIIGKKQHDTHDYTLDIHTLGVLQECIKNPEFQTLNEQDKQTLILSALLHDITKLEGKRDSKHSANSAYDAYYILDKLNLSKQQKADIYQLIKSHEILANCGKKIYDYSLKQKRHLNDEELDKVLQGYAYELRSANSAQLEMILTKADLLSTHNDGSFYQKHANLYNIVCEKLQKGVQNVRATSILLPQTKIPKASELKADGVNLVEKVTYDADGNPIRNKVLYLKPGMNLEALGFGKGVTTDNFSVLIHGFDDEIQQVTLDALDLPDKNALLSTSYVSYRKGNYHAFRPQGFIKEVLSDEIGAAYYKDFGSGYKKTIDSLIKNYITGQNIIYREYFSNLIKRELNISDEEYVQIYDSIKNKSLDEIEQENPKVADAFKNIIDNMEIAKRKFNRDYNEILVGKTRNTGIFFEGNDVKGNKYEFENMPEFLRKYAQDNDLLVIHFGD